MNHCIGQIFTKNQRKKVQSFICSRVKLEKSIVLKQRAAAYTSICTLNILFKNFYTFVTGPLKGEIILSEILFGSCIFSSKKNRPEKKKREI